MSRRNYWTTLRQRKISRRTMLGASAKAGVGAAGLALVGCGDDDDDAAPAAVDTSAIDAAAGDASAAASAAGEASAAASEASAAASEAAAAASQAADAADAAAALAAEAAESEDAANAAAAAEAAAAAAADAAAAASAAGDQAAAAVAAAASEAAEAAAQAARDAAAAVEAGTATAEAAQAAIDEAAEAAAAAAAAAGEASAAAGAAAATAQETAEAAAETAAAAVAAAEEAADAAREAAESAAMAAEDEGPAAGEVDFDATLRIAASSDAGGLDLIRSGSHANGTIGHGLFNRSTENDPETGIPVGQLLQWENPDDVTWNFTVTDNVFFHNGQQLTAEDIIFTHERAGGIAEYHQGGETSDHPAGWASQRTGHGVQHWASHEQTGRLHWNLTTNGPDATLPGVTFGIQVYSKADTEERGDAAVDAEPMGSGYVRFGSHTADTEFVFERNDDYFQEWSRTPTAAALGSSPKRQVHLVRPERLSQLAGIEAGEIDVAFGLTADLVEPIRDDDRFKVGSGWSGGPNQYLLPNLVIDELNGGPNPFRDERVRKALNHAVDKQAIIDNLMGGEGNISYNAWAGSAFYPKAALEAIGPYAYDPELAKSLLAEAGYPDGFKTPFHFVDGSYIPTDPAVALFLEQQFAAVGVELEMNPYPVGEFYGMVRTREQPGLNLIVNGAAAEPEWMIKGHIAPTDGDTYSLGPPEYFPGLGLQELRDRTRTSVDPEERAAAIEELYVRHYKAAGFIFLTEIKSFHVTAANIEWPIGAAQFAGQFSIHQINVLTT